MKAGRRLAVAYTAGVLVPAAAVVAVLLPLGGAPSSADAASIPKHGDGGFDVNHVLLAVALVVGAAHAGGALAARLGQPRVVGQATVGLLLGPSALGSLAPTWAAWLQRGGTPQAVDLLAQLGVVLFVFLIGRELGGARRQHTAGPVLVIGQVMVLVPLLCGVLLAILLLPPPPGVGALPHALFVGLAMSATALPVLAHILAERRLLTSRIGAIGTSAAAVGDATIWCLLSIAMCRLHRGSLTTTGLRLGGALLFAAVVWWLLRPLARRALTSERDSSYALPALLLCTLLLCAATTDLLGLHAIFGAFLVGLATPAGAVTAQRVTVMAQGATEWLLLPLFFTAVGSRTHLGLLSDTPTILLCLLVLAIAVGSKVISAGAAGRIIGFTWRDSAALGVLMNCRGLTELLLLNVGHTAGIIDDRTFTVFVVMALVTTAATGPLLDALGLRRSALTPAGAARPLAAEAQPA